MTASKRVKQDGQKILMGLQDRTTEQEGSAQNSPVSPVTLSRIDGNWPAASQNALNIP